MINFKNVVLVVSTLALGALGALVVSCSDGGQNSDILPPMSMERVQVLDFWPPENYAYACPNEEIRITFDNPVELDGNNQNLNSYVQIKQVGDATKTFSCTWRSGEENQDSGYQVICTPSPVFDNGTRISVSVLTGLQDATGRPSVKKTWEFQIGVDASTGKCGMSNFRPIDINTNSGRIFVLKDFGQTMPENNAMFEFQNNNWFNSTLQDVALPVATPLFVIRFSQPIKDMFLNNVAIFESFSFNPMDWATKPIISMSGGSGSGLLGNMLSNTKKHVYGSVTNFECAGMSITENDPDYMSRAVVLCPDSSKVDTRSPRLYFIVLPASVTSKSGVKLGAPYLAPWVMNNLLIGTK